MSMQVKPVIAIGGENLIDSVQSVSPSGEPQRADNLGGSPYNVAIALARQGTAAHYLTPISTDDFGVQLAHALEQDGVIVSGPRSDAPTTQAVVTLHDGVPQYVFHRENTAERMISAEIIEAAMPEGATHFHAGSLAFAGGADADVWEVAFHAAAQRGLTTSLDPNVRASLIDDPAAYRARILRLLASATIVKLSDEDLGWLYPDQPIAEAMTRLRSETGAELVALTKGPLGAECWTTSGHCVASNPSLSMLVDTIGAGDTFMATLLARLAAGANLSGQAISALSQAEIAALLERCLYAACLNCAKQGCNPPTSDAIDAALAKGMI